MYCHQCGKEIDDSVQYCPYCGAPQSMTQNNENQYQNQNYQNYQTNTSYVNEQDESHIGWAILAFFIPIAGLVLYLVWRNEFPKKAKSCLHGLIAGIVIEVVMFCCVAASFAGIASSSSDDSFDSFFDEDIDTNFNWYVNEIVE